MLAASKIRDGFANGKARSTSLTNYYLYAVWLLVYALLSIPVAGTRISHRVQSVGDFFVQLVAPDTPLWFVFALAVYVPVLALCRRLPAVAVLAALAGLSIFTLLMIPSGDPGQWWKLPELAFFFAVGVYGKTLLLHIAEARKLVCGAVAIPAFLGLSVLSFALNLPLAVEQVVFILRGLAAVVALVAVISALTKNRVMAAAGSWVGKRTLGIYLLHTPVLDVIVLAFQGPLHPAAPVIANSVPLALIYPLALTAAVVSMCIALEYFFKKCGLGFLFRRPQAGSASRHRQPVLLPALVHRSARLSRNTNVAASADPE